MDNIELKQEWIPIGDYTRDKYFTGTFDGNYHKISNLNIKQNNYLQGMFVKIENNGKVSNLSIQGKIMGSNNLGLLAGECEGGTIKNVKVSGKVIGAINVGGLIGYANKSTIECCSSEVEIEGKNNVGGLIGRSEGNTISESYANTKVTAELYVGGLIGVNINSVSITNVYSKGIVIGKEYIGGLVGGKDGKSGIYDDIYTISSVTCTDNSCENNPDRVGAVIAVNWNWPCNIYWCPKISNVDLNPDIGVRVEKEEDMKKKETYETFDFENIWIMKEYPELRCFVNEE